MTVRESDFRSLANMNTQARKLFFQSSTAMAIVDMETLVYVNVNEVFAQRLGYTPEEIVGKTIWDLTPEEDIEELRKYVEIHLNQVDRMEFELDRTYLTKDGGRVETRVHVLQFGPEKIAIVWRTNGKREA